MWENKFFSAANTKKIAALLITLLLGIVLGSLAFLKLNTENPPQISVYSANGLIKVNANKYCDTYISVQNIIEGKQPNCVNYYPDVTTGKLADKSEVVLSIPYSQAKQLWGYCVEQKDLNTKQLSHYCRYPNTEQRKAHRVVIKNADDNFRIETIEVHMPLLTHDINKSKTVQPVLDQSGNLADSRVWIFKNQL